MNDRARQFLPFDALTGFKQEIQAKEIIKKEKRELSEEEKEYLSFMLLNLKKDMLVEITYYESIKYKSLKGMIERIDYIDRFIYVNNKRIDFDDIYDIKSNQIEYYKDSCYSC